MKKDPKRYDLQSEMLFPVNPEASPKVTKALNGVTSTSSVRTECQHSKMGAEDEQEEEELVKDGASESNSLMHRQE